MIFKEGDIIIQKINRNKTYFLIELILEIDDINYKYSALSGSFSKDMVSNIENIKLCEFKNNFENMDKYYNYLSKFRLTTDEEKTLFFLFNDDSISDDYKNIFNQEKLIYNRKRKIIKIKKQL